MTYSVEHNIHKVTNKMLSNTGAYITEYVCIRNGFSLPEQSTYNNNKSH